jgi:hypothetical protein
MKYSEWLRNDKPFNTLFYVERAVEAAERPLGECVAELCRTLRVVDVYVLSKHRAQPIEPGEVLATNPDIKACSMDHRRIFTVSIEGGNILLKGRQYYEVTEEDYEEEY